MQTFTIGRDASNQIVLNDNQVSRRHAQMTIMDNGQVMIKDLGSSNGTFVNGNKITECYLNTGDIVKCGSVFLNWSEYVVKSSQPLHQMNYQPSTFNQPGFQEQHAYSGEVQFGLGGVFKYLATRIFEIGDLFKTNWNKTTSISFLKGMPVFLTLIISAILYSNLPFGSGRFSILPTFLAIFIFAISPFITFYLLSASKQVSTDKIALASGIFGFLQFSSLLCYFIFALIFSGGNSDLLGFDSPYYQQRPVFLLIIVGLLGLIIICIIAIAYYVFMYKYFISIGVNRSVAIYLLVVTPVLNAFFQILFTYLFSLSI